MYGKKDSCFLFTCVQALFYIHAEAQGVYPVWRMLTRHNLWLWVTNQQYWAFSFNTTIVSHNFFLLCLSDYILHLNLIRKLLLLWAWKSPKHCFVEEIPQISVSGHVSYSVPCLPFFQSLRQVKNAIFYRPMHIQFIKGHVQSCQGFYISKTPLWHVTHWWLLLYTRKSKIKWNSFFNYSFSVTTINLSLSGSFCHQHVPSL